MGWEIEDLVSELNQGMELAKELNEQLILHPRNHSEDCAILVQKILCCYDNALMPLLNCNGDGDSRQPSTTLIDSYNDSVPEKRKRLSRLIGFEDQNNGLRNYGQEANYQGVGHRTQECLTTKEGYSESSAIYKEEGKGTMLSQQIMSKQEFHPKTNQFKADDVTRVHNVLCAGPEFTPTPSNQLPDTNFPFDGFGFFVDEVDFDFSLRRFELH